MGDKDYFKRDVFLFNRHYVDYLNYILKNDPQISLALFPGVDRQKIYRFIKNVFISCFFEEIDDGRVFGKDEWREFTETKDYVSKLIRFKKGVFFFDNFYSIAPCEFNLIYKNWYLDIFKRKKLNIAIDAGAYFGDSSFVINRFFKPKFIYAFEPDPDNFKILKENIKLNNLQDVIFPLEIGVGKEKGFFYLEKSGPGSSITNYQSKNKNKVKVKVVSIDDFVADNNIKKVDFIKMDIEGAEFDALKGAVKTLKRDKPDLLIAIYHKGEHFFEIPGWLKKQVPEYNLRFVAMSGASPINERYVG